MKRLHDRTSPSGRRQIVLEHEWREDFVGEALTIEVGDRGEIHMVEFYSADHGVVRWSAGQGLGSARRWETEDEASSRSGIAGGHYAATLLDSAIPDTHCLAIVCDVLKHFDGTPLGASVRDALAKPHADHILADDRLPGTEQRTAPEPAPAPQGGFANFMGRAVRDLMRPSSARSRTRESDGE